MMGPKISCLSKMAAEISKVFGISKQEATEFMERMDNRKFPDEAEGYFKKFMEKLSPPKYFLLPTPPTKPAYPRPPILTNIRGKDTLKLEEKTRRTNIHKTFVTKYENSLKKYEEDLQRYQAEAEADQHRKTPLNDEIYVNMGEYTTGENGRLRPYPKGEFGMVKWNKSRPQFVYKFIQLTDSYEESLKTILCEPLINCILQQDTKASPFVCKLYNVYSRKLGPGYEIVYKLENLDIPVDFLIRSFTSETKEQNIRILLKLFAPLYETLAHLRTNYNFNHGDLHLNNLMLTKNPFTKEGTIDETTLQVKMIDFGFSSLDYEGIKYGTVNEEYEKEVQAFYFQMGNKLPPEFLSRLPPENSNHILIEEFIIEEAKTKIKTKTGGRRKKTAHTTRKQKRRK